MVLLIFLGAMIYTMTYCWLYGYGRAPESVTFVWGIPDWVMWGVFAPWGACYLISIWFSYGFMTDADLGEEQQPPSEAPSGTEARNA